MMITTELKELNSVIQSDWMRWSGLHKIALFSGGKDSLAVLSLCKEHYDDRLEAVYVDTSAGFFLETMDYVKSICELLNLPCKILKSPDFFEVASRWGFPSVKARWCCRELKLKPVKEYLRTIKEPKVLFSGIRAEESVKRKLWFEERIRKGHDPSTFYHPFFKCFSVTPVWDWSDKQVENYIRDKGLPINPAYKDGIHSLACPCVLFASMKQIEIMRTKRPDLFQKFKELESKMKSDWKPLKKGSQYLYFRDLEQQRLMDAWL